MSQAEPEDIGAFITDEDVERCKRQVGVSRYARALPFNTRATYDAIRRYAFSYGDDNPLWHDREYGHKTRWGSQIAPPMFYVSTGVNTAPPPDEATKALLKGLFKGINKYYSGVTWTWWRPLKTNNVAYQDDSTSNVIVRESSSFSGARTVTEIYRKLWFDETGAGYAMSEESYVNAERKGAREKGRYKDVERQRYTPEDIARIDAVYAAEHRQGAIKRYWEDVNVGDKLTPVAKGPHSMVEVIAYHMGHGLSTYGIGPLRYNAMLRQKMPGFFSNDRYGVPDVAQRVHWDAERAVELGFPAPYDYGQMRADWLTHLVTNWMGDDAWLWKLSLEVRSFNFFGDATICSGEVVDKRVEEGRHVVELALAGVNQRGETTVPGAAVVILPTRNAEAELPPVPAELAARMEQIAANRVQKGGAQGW